MARTYPGQGEDDLHATTDKSLWNLHATTATRPAIAHIVVGCSATPAESAARFEVRRTTTKGTGGTEVTAVKALDPSEPASIGSYTPAPFSAEPTYTTGNGELLYDFSMYQRNPAHWYANSEKFEFKCPATANNGIGLRAIESNAGTAIHNSNFLWRE